MSKFFRAITTSIVLIGTACSSGSDVPAVADEVDMVSLAGSEWVLQAFGPEDDQVVSVEPAITVMFGADSTFAGSAGCNRYFGRFLTPGGDSLAMGEAGSTMMACPEPAMAQEYRYLQTLGNVGHYRMAAGELVLLDETGQLLRFVRGQADD